MLSGFALDLNTVQRNHRHTETEFWQDFFGGLWQFQKEQGQLRLRSKSRHFLEPIKMLTILFIQIVS